MAAVSASDCLPSEGRHCIGVTHMYTRTGCDSGNFDWWGNPSGSEAREGKERALEKGEQKMSNDVAPNYDVDQGLIHVVRTWTKKKGKKRKTDSYLKAPVVAIHCLINLLLRTVWEPELTRFFPLESNLASITAAVNWVEVYRPFTSGWKNDAWNTCSTCDTDQMNSVFTHSHNKKCTGKKAHQRSGRGLSTGD